MNNTVTLWTLRKTNVDPQNELGDIAAGQYSRTYGGLEDMINEPKQVILYGHTAAVTNIQFDTTKLVSCSVDHTAKVLLRFPSFFLVCLYQRLFPLTRVCFSCFCSSNH